MRPLSHSPRFLLLLCAVLTACGNEEVPVHTVEAQAEAARPASRGPGAFLEARGGLQFSGRTGSRCLPHEDAGLQVSFRTGDADMPAVAVQVERFTGEGVYRGRLFVTGRNVRGALVRSIGECEIEVRQREGPDAATVLLAGELRGAYRGAAGQGEIAGRFGPCSFVRPVIAAPPEAVAHSDGPAPRRASD